MRKICYCLLAFLLLGCFATAGAITRYTISETQIYQVRYRIEIKNGSNPALNYKMTFPVFAAEDLPPFQKLLSFKMDSQKFKLLKTENGPLLEFAVGRLVANQVVKLEVDYTFSNSAIDFALLPGPDTGGVEPYYLLPEKGVESDAPSIVTLAEKITSPAIDPMEKAKKLFAYINSSMQYQPQSEGVHSALRTLQRGWGSCEDFSLLYIALCRSVGIPARYVSGYRFSPEEVGRRETDLDQFAHAWVEVYLPGIGWLPVDPTFVYTENGEKKVNFDFFGRINRNDRHLFFSYTRQQERSVSWSYETRNPAEVTTNFHTLISKQ